MLGLFGNPNEEIFDPNSDDRRTAKQVRDDFIAKTREELREVLPLPPGLEIKDDELFFEVDPPEIKIPSLLPLPSVKDIERMIKEDQEEEEK